jgi:GT2 family glycosyltransferase
MDVSVIIVNYNTFDLTAGCIRSVLSKTSGCSFEVIVVDNASTERDPQELKDLFPQIQLIKNSVNMGFARGNNSGIKVASGDYVLLLNSDTELANNAILVCLESIRGNNGVAAIGCKLIFPDGSTQHSCQRFPSVRYKAFELLRLQKLLPRQLRGKILLGYFFDHNSRIFPDWIWGAFFMFKRSLLDILPGGKLADEFFMYVEDMQWCMDFAAVGYRVAFEPDAQVIHYMGQSKGAKSSLMETNMETFMARYYSPWRIAVIKQLNKWLH